MGHVVSPCDVLDILEESVTARRPVAVELEGGRSFTDQVTDVVTENGEDYVDFRDHRRLLVKPGASPGRPGRPSARRVRDHGSGVRSATTFKARPTRAVVRLTWRNCTYFRGENC